ncbi:hypothetical protein [Niveibacterium sp. SC-1]|uniref:hypothetical protein n=1 Tax=Niveibacterium sp. SC-1 TaxID=3135646 RepID=UPI00312030C1
MTDEIQSALLELAERAFSTQKLALHALETDLSGEDLQLEQSLGSLQLAVCKLAEAGYIDPAVMDGPEWRRSPASRD